MKHRRHVNPLVSGFVTIAVLAVTTVSIIVAGVPGGPSIPLPWSHPADLKAQLADADGLQPHSGVQIAGVKVGEVHRVDFKDGMALVDMQIDPQYFDIHRDAQVLLRPHGLFGPKYIELVAGTRQQPALADGSTIGIQHSVQPVDLDQLLSALQAPERANLRTFITELGKAAAGRGDDVNHLLASTRALAGALDTPVQTLDRISPNLSDLLVRSEQFNSSFATTPLDQLIANNNVVLGTLAANADHLQSILVHADSTFTTLDAALNGQSGSIRQFLEAAPATIDQLNRFNNLLGLFGRHLQGQDQSVPGNTDVTSGIIAAIENPKSAFSSYDVCTAGQADCVDGKRYYLKVRAFNLGGTNDLINQVNLCGLPVFGLVPGLPCPLKAGDTAQPFGAALASATEVGSFSAMLGS